MPFPLAVPRTHLHTRTIDCKGYLRDDGLWDIEAQLVDTKTYTLENRWRGPLQPGDPIHNMGLRLTIDHDFIIKQVATTMDDQPHPVCNEVLVNFQRLIGLKIGPGWNRKTRELLGGIEGCTHLVELLGPMATVVFQTTASDSAKAMARKISPENYPVVHIDAEKKPFVLNGCHTWRSASPAVKEMYPLHYTGTDSDQNKARVNSSAPNNKIFYSE